MIECVNGCIYNGYTTDIERRYKEHCKYTKAFPPKRLLACWNTSAQDKPSALKLEIAIKKLTKKKKVELIAKPYVLPYTSIGSGFAIHSDH